MNRLLRIFPTIAASVFISLLHIPGPTPGQLGLIGLLLGLVMAAGLLLAVRRSQFTPLDLAFTVYTVLGGLALLLQPLGPARLLLALPTATLYFLLLVTAALPPLLGGTPFTEYFARRATPEIFWQTPEFKQINRVMTWVWAGLFALSTLSALLPWLAGSLPAWQTHSLTIGLPMALMLGGGLWFNKWYPAYYQRKAGQPSEAAGQAGQASLATSPQDAQTCRELLQAMPLAFDPAAAGDMEAVIQFEVSGEDFTVHLVISQGTCTFHEGPAEKADLVIKTPAEVWLAIARQELDGRQALMSGKYQAQGNIGPLIRMNELFNNQR